MEFNMILVLIGLLLFIGVLILSYFFYFSKSLWMKALVCGAPVNPFRLILMRMRDIDPKLILESRIKTAKSGVRISTAQLESHILTGVDIGLILDATIKASQAGIKIDTTYLGSHQLSGGDVNLIVDSQILADKAGLDVSIDQLGSHNLSKGDVQRVVQAMIIAKKANIPLDFDRASAIDLAGRDILEAVQMRVQPRVIKTEPVTAVAKDGIELIVTARVTVQMDLERLVGGAGEDTILARVGEGVVAAIGSAKTHEHILEDPQSVSKKIWTEGLDKNTAFNVLSVDIADVDVGKNIGAKHKIEAAEASKKVAQAEAEKREQEMRTRNMEMEARIKEKEAEVQEAMAEAFRTGKLGVMDFYRMKSMRADIDMRRSLALAQKKPSDDDD